jgi:hypothetical protein
MNRGWKWFFLFSFSIAVGIWIGVNDFTSLQEWLLVFFIFITLFLMFSVPALYTLYFTQNIDTVELFLNRSKAKNPVYAVMLGAANGEFEAVERTLPLIRNKQVQISVSIMLHLERQEIAQARKQVNNIQLASNRNYYKALIAILEEDWENVTEFQAGIRNKALHYVIEAEVAFKQGNREDSVRAGQLALASAKGLQKFMLLRSLERQENNPIRRTYF